MKKKTEWGAAHDDNLENLTLGIRAGNYDFHNSKIEKAKIRAADFLPKFEKRHY